ncbi:MAG: hypothetical protein E7493_12005 [Ruminococcus albus]|nr:hypothetical protein [Ruminococcus albus]
MQVIRFSENAVIPLTHHKNSGFTELKVAGLYHSPACGGEKYQKARPYFSKSVSSTTRRSKA